MNVNYVNMENSVNLRLERRKVWEEILSKSFQCECCHFNLIQNEHKGRRLAVQSADKFAIINYSIKTNISLSQINFVSNLVDMILYQIAVTVPSANTLSYCYSLGNHKPSMI